MSICMNCLKPRRKDGAMRSIDEMARLCVAAGFRYVDYTPDYISADWREKAQRDREVLDCAGIIVEQTHAPYNRYGAHPDELFSEYYRRVFEASKIMGAKYVVVHADEYRTVDHYDEQEIEDFTYDFLAPYVDYAVRAGMTVAIENVFEDGIRRRPAFDGKSRYTSRLHELLNIINRFNMPSVKCCWDFGHANCAFGKEKMVDMMKQVGAYICCTHVHDNYYGKDLHLVPFLGEIDWEAHMMALRQIGYQGKLSFETGYERFPDALLGKWLCHAADIGQYLIGLYDAAQ